MVLRRGVALALLVATVGCDSDPLNERPNERPGPIDVSAAAAAASPQLLLDCPDQLTQEPGYDWEDVGVGQPTVAAAVNWFREQMPSEFHGAMGTGELLLDDAFEVDGTTHVPLAVDGRVIAVLEVFDHQQGLIVWGAVACDSPITTSPANS